MTRTYALLIIAALLATILCWGCLSSTVKPPVGDAPPPRTPAQEKFEFMLVGVAGLGIVIMVASIAACVWGLAKVGVVGFLAGMAVEGACVMLLYYGREFAWVLCVLSCVVLIALLWWGYAKRKRIFGEVLRTCEKAKAELPISKRQEIFGGLGQTGYAEFIQSPDTVRAVAAGRKQLGFTQKKGG